MQPGDLSSSPSTAAHIEPFEGEANFERFLATLRGEIPDRVPHFEILIEDEHVEKLLGRPAGNTLGVGGDPAKGSEAGEGVQVSQPVIGDPSAA